MSPHLDDAVLSAGQVLLGWPDPTVVTVFAGTPEVPVVTDYDTRSGFADSTEAVLGRRLEDRRACAVVGAEPVWLDLLDEQYRNEPASAIGHLVGEHVNSGDHVLGPLGLRHPDHVAVSNALVRFAHGAGWPLWLYEELPYRVQWPDVVADRIGRLHGHGIRLRPEFIGTGPIEWKEAAVACYRSQVWAVDRRCCSVPERIWRVEWESE